MSDRVSWEVCPGCGGPLAVGWAAVSRSAAAPTPEEPVEFDCPSGCDLTVSELRGFASSGMPASRTTSVGRPRRGRWPGRRPV